MPRTLSTVLMIALAALAACDSKDPPPAAVDTATGATTASPRRVQLSIPSARAAVTAIGSGPAAAKAPIAGLIDMQDISWHNADGGEPSFTTANVAQFPGLFGGIVLNATWDALEPMADGALITDTIESALAQVRAYNAANPTAPLGVKLRVYAGSNAPGWAKSLAGGPVSIVRNPQGCASPPCALTVGKTWAPEYIAAWRKLQARLAAKYDSEPLIRQVAVTSCGMQTDEPFVPSVAPEARRALAAAGYTDDVAKACLSGAVSDYSAWKSTLIDYTVNVFSHVAGGGEEPAFSTSVMQECRAALGPRCVLDNHALSAPLRAADASIYRDIARLGGPINFQTEAPRGMDCQWQATIAQGAKLGAVAIEVWPAAKLAGFDGLAPGDLATLAAALKTPPNAVPEPTSVPKPCSGFH